ncbi:MAG: hypothetical protein Q8N05_04445, partial [Bacteroidota bacterium]|nr:hypothetical protein [Bacteroidota bacterium]
MPKAGSPSAKLVVNSVSELVEIIQAPLTRRKKPPITITYRPTPKKEDERIILGTKCLNGGLVDVSAPHLCICDDKQLDRLGALVLGLIGNGLGF